MIKDAKGKNVGKTIIFFHYFEENDPYRIERSPVITGDLKMGLTSKTKPNYFFRNSGYSISNTLYPNSIRFTRLSLNIKSD